MDLGECPKIHELALRADYEQAAKERDYGYVVDVSKTLLVGNIKYITNRKRRCKFCTVENLDFMISHIFQCFE